MQVQVRTDKNIDGSQSLIDRVESVVKSALERFGDRITRAEIHLSDVNGADRSGGDDKRCVLEVRLAGRPPVAVSHQAQTVDLAVEGAARKMEHSLTSSLGRLAHR